MKIRQNISQIALAALILVVQIVSAQGNKNSSPRIANQSIAAGSSKYLFEENKGQWPEQVLYKADLIGGRRVFFENDRFTYIVYNASQVDAVHEDSHGSGKIDFERKIDMHAFQMQFIGAHTNSITCVDQSSFYSNYYIGNNPSNWASSVHNFRKIKYENLYPGIDVELFENNGSLKYDYLVKAGTSTDIIRLQVIGANKLSLNKGNLSIQTSVGEIVESIPSSYQIIKGKRVEVFCEFVIAENGKEISFRFPNGYDKEYDLVIDPVVVGSTYTGSTTQNYGHCATFDAAGNIYSGARAFGAGYPVTTGAFQSSFGSGVDIAISKLSPNSSTLLYATYIGGTLQDLPHSMFVSTNNELVVYGSSSSNNYPTSATAFDNSANGQDDMVITRLNSTGTGIIGSTYVGGSGNDAVNLGVSINYGDNYRGEVVADNAGNIFVVGSSASTNFPVTAGAYNTTLNGGQDAVVLKLNPTLSALTWATYLGGTQDDAGCSIRINSLGDIYVVGGTEGSGFPTTTGAITTAYSGGNQDAFVSRLSSNGASLLSSTYLGTNLMDIVYFIDLDFSDQVYVYGVSAGSMPISPGVYNNPGSQNFVMQLSPALNSIAFSTVLGNGQHLSFSPSALMVDYCRNIYLCGWGTRSNYPVTPNAAQTNSPVNSFQLMVLSQNATSLLYSSPFGSGGEHVDGGTSRFDKNGIVYQGVCACSGSFPTTTTAYSPTKLTGGCDMAVFKVNFEVNCDAFSPTAKICYGSSASFTLPNISSLQSPTYVVQPGNLINSTGLYTFSPTSNTQYTATLSGYNNLNALITTTGIISITVTPQPALSPTITQPTCTNTLTTINLGLGFLPSNATPNYSVQWSPMPGGITSNTQVSVTGFVPAAVYQTTVVAAGGCSATAVFTINPVPTIPSFTLVGPFDITCDNSIRTVSAVPASNSYTWSCNTLNQTGSAVSFSAANAGTCQLIVSDGQNGCSTSQIFTITLNNALPASTVTPVLQTLNCLQTTLAVVNASLNPIVNCSSYWLSPLGGTVIAPGATSQYNPFSPGTYTHVTVNLTNGCKAFNTFTISSNVGFPTYTVNSPQNFTLGCTTKSVATINIVNGQTDPPGGSVSYTILAPGFAGSYGTGTVSTYTNIVAPGQYTTVTKDNVTMCESKAIVTILQNTASPAMQINLPYNTLTCDYPSVLLQAYSATPNTSIAWRFGQVPVSLLSDSLRIKSNGVASATLNGNYTLTITDNNNTCVTTTVIPILQNIRQPNVLFTGVAPISCKVHTVTLTNQSTSNVPPVFNPTAAVIGYLWRGPSPQLPLQLSTTYLAESPGVYTLTGKDLNNGCLNTFTAMIEDNRDYPSFNIPSNTFILPCGSETVNIYPTVLTETKSLQYQWQPNGDAAFTSLSTATTGVNRLGHYDVIVTNTVNGCVASALVLVEEDSLQANFTASAVHGFVPFDVQFTNLSISVADKKNNLPSSKCYWNFGNGLYSAVQGSISPVTRYVAPGTYTVKLFVNSGVCADTAQLKIQVDLPSRLNVPNVFSPNGDNVNDLFFVEAANLLFIHIKIVDRWGHLVYELESESGNIAWDGKNQQGKNCSDGVYMYTITANGSDGANYDQSGIITLVR